MKRTAVRFLIAIWFVAAGYTIPAAAGNDYVVPAHELRGGVMDDFIRATGDFKGKKVRVVLSGLCMSSCTLYTALAPQNLVCAKPGTKFVFHRPFRATNIQVDANGGITTLEVTRPSSPATVQRFWMQYPLHVRRAILTASHGRGLPMLGRELTIPAEGIPHLGIDQLVPRC